MNEDARGITPANVTAMTVEQIGNNWRVTIEQGNGDVIKTLNLTPLERAELGMMLDSPGIRHMEFVDSERYRLETQRAHAREAEPERRL